MALDLLDHLGVVVGDQRRLVVVHRQPADEVGQEGVRGGLELGVLAQEVVDLPRLVADPQVIAGLAHDVGEDHEVGEQDLVHVAPGAEHRQRVLARVGLDVRDLARELRRGRVDRLTGRL